jgi:hypothetical protein
MTELLLAEKEKDPLVERQLELGRQKVREMTRKIADLQKERDKIAGYGEQVFYSIYDDAEFTQDEYIQDLDHRIEMMQHYLRIYRDGMKQIEESGGEILVDDLWKLINAVGNFYYYAGEAEENFAGVVELKEDNAVCLFTQGYLVIQDQTDDLEIDFQGSKLNIDWSSERAIEAFKSYFSVLNDAREQHKELWEIINKELNDSDYLQRIIVLFGGKDNFQRYLNDYLQDRTTVFVFFSVDNPKEVKNMGVDWDYFMKKTLPFAKISEYGTVSDSAEYRFDSDDYGEHRHKRGHSLISFCQRMVLLDLFKNIEEALINNAEHEGYHLIIDKLVNKLIKPKKFFPSQEGWVIANSLDKRHLHFTTEAKFSSLISPTIEEYQKNFKEHGYYSWPRFFQALYFLVKEEGLNNREEIWKRLSVVMIEAAVDIAEDQSLMKQDDAVKFGNLAQKMIEKLGFEETQVGDKYEEINRNPQGFYDQMVQDRDKGRDEQL